jgi:hypothetical protein
MTTTKDNQSHRLAAKAALVLSGLALTTGIGIASAGNASASNCATIASDIAYHNNKFVDQSNSAAVAAFNREADALNATARSCGFTLTP